jgi:hypothetical protein
MTVYRDILDDPAVQAAVKRIGAQFPVLSPERFDRVKLLLNPEPLPGEDPSLWADQEGE